MSDIRDRAIRSLEPQVLYAMLYWMSITVHASNKAVMNEATSRLVKRHKKVVITTRYNKMCGAVDRGGHEHIRILRASVSGPTFHGDIVRFLEQAVSNE